MPPPEKKKVDYFLEDCETLGPGPGAYKLPPTVGYDNHDMSRWRGPAYSIGKRVTVKIKSITPGPVYNVRGLNRFGNESCATGYSINSRVQMKRKSMAPGPGAYAPEKYPYPKGKNPPAFSIRGKSTYTEKPFGPGPNQYILPTTIGYNVPDMKCAPAARICGRFDKNYKTDTPGPASYGVPNYDAIKFIFPSVPIAGRHFLKTPQRSPGPLAYFPKFVTGPNAPAFSIRPRVGRCIKPYITPEDTCD